MNDHEYHEIANIFPMMSQTELTALADDIKHTGLQNKITLYENKILDGRNRYEACKLVGVTPEYEQYQGSDPLRTIISLNLRRRHLNESQRAVIAARVANMEKGNFSKSANLPISPISQTEAADIFNVSERMIRKVKSIEREAPELIRETDKGKTINEIEKLIKEKKTNEKRQELVKAAQSITPDKRWDARIGDIATYHTTKKYEFIITDPPYPKEYLGLYTTLSKRANEWLRPGGLAIVMCGQSYINQIYVMMSQHLEYYWTACYLTPGQPTPIRTRQVNTTWKPILIFSRNGEKYSGKIFGDVFRSDGNDKSLHEWGQSESGMFSLISQIALPGQSIFDPFMGAGTTGMAALRHGCLFDGIDINEEFVNISKGRLAQIDTQEKR